LIEYKKTKGLFHKWVIALTRNLSASGLLFRAQEIIDTNTILKIKLSLPDEKKPFHLIAKVVRINSTKRGDFFDIAIVFTQINPDDKIKLDQFCKEHENKNEPSSEDLFY